MKTDYLNVKPCLTVLKDNCIWWLKSIIIKVGEPVLLNEWSELLNEVLIIIRLLLSSKPENDEKCDMTILIVAKTLLFHRIHCIQIIKCCFRQMNISCEVKFYLVKKYCFLRKKYSWKIGFVFKCIILFEFVLLKSTLHHQTILHNLPKQMIKISI